MLGVRDPSARPSAHRVSQCRREAQGSPPCFQGLTHVGGSEHPQTGGRGHLSVSGHLLGGRGPLPAPHASWFGSSLLKPTAPKLCVGVGFLLWSGVPPARPSFLGAAPSRGPGLISLLAGLLAFEPLCVSGWLASVALAHWGLTERLWSSSTEGMCPLERKTPWGPRDRPAPCPVRWAGGSSPAVRRKETICSPAGLRTALGRVAEPSCS